MMEDYNVYPSNESAIVATQDLRTDYLSTLDREGQHINGQGFWCRKSLVENRERVLEPATVNELRIMEGFQRLIIHYQKEEL